MDDVLTSIDEWGPEKIVCISDPATNMRGVLVIDNTARGMGKGGTRMSPSLTVSEVSRLARVMTWKWAVADLFYGGAKAGIRFDPASPAKEKALRAWVRGLAKHIPGEYVAGLDMGLSESDAAIIQDELGDRGASVGTPRELGGLPYDELGFTGYGVAECTEAASEFAAVSLKGSSVAIQGFGAVGASAAERLVAMGATVSAVSTAKGCIYSDNGLDIDRLLQLRKEVGDDLVDHYSGAESIEAGSELCLPVDVVIPAARQDVIDERVAHQIRANVLVEGANLPTSQAARKILRERGVVVVPDFVANAGAIVATAVAMDARYSAIPPNTEPIYSLISKKLRANSTTVLEEAAQEDITPHQAALGIAQRRVQAAMKLRGRAPATS